MSDQPSVSASLCLHEVLNHTLIRLRKPNKRLGIFIVSQCPACGFIAEERPVGRGAAAVVDRKAV